MRILIDLPSYIPALPALKNLPGIEVEWVEKPEEKTRTLPTEQIKDCEMLFCMFPPQNHAEMSALKLIQIASAGYKQLVGHKFDERGVRACNALGVFDVPIGEWNMAMMVNLARDLRGLIRHQESQVWDRSARFQEEIRGRVVGLWGYGGIGRETARLAKSLGMKVHVLSRGGVQPREHVYCVPGTGDPEGKMPDRVFLYPEKAEFLQSLDFLIMAMPQTASTEGILGEAEFKLLRRHAFLLNPARGPLIQEQALLRALREGWIAGAAIDTHYHYPLPASHPLWKMPNVILTPHIAGSSGSPRFLERVYDMFAQNVQRWQKRQPLLNELTPSQLQGN